MAVDLSNTLVIGVSSRALFDLEKENEVFEKYGVVAFRKYQLEHENEILQPGAAFYLVKSLLQLNNQAHNQIVEVVIMSSNSPETAMRVLKSVNKYELPITRMAFTGGQPMADYIKGFNIDLFLSKDAKDIQKIIDSAACAAALIYDPPKNFNPDNSLVKIAFDADAVIFSEDSEFRYKTEGIEAFQQFEKENQEIPIPRGPFANLLIKLSKIQDQLPKSIELSPLRIAIVTARSAPAHMRVINTLREWGVYVDEIFFLGGLPKEKILHSFGAHIFFDDQEVHLDAAAKLVPSGKVPYSSNSKMHQLK
jgi:5'-nucleotidase